MIFALNLISEINELLFFLFKTNNSDLKPLLIKFEHNSNAALPAPPPSVSVICKILIMFFSKNI